MLLVASCAGPASASVIGLTPNGFSVTLTATTPAGPSQVYATIGRVDQWWNPAQTYSGQAGNLSLVLKPGGCSCERLPNGLFDHRTVTAVQPGREVRLSGTLGPLRQLARSGEMVIRLDPLQRGSRISLSYQVSGIVADKAKELAPAVGGVLGEQLARLAAAASER